MTSNELEVLKTNLLPKDVPNAEKVISLVELYANRAEDPIRFFYGVADFCERMAILLEEAEKPREAKQ